MEAYVNAVIEEHYHTLPLSVKALGGGFYGRVFLAVLPEAPFRVVIKLYLYPGLALQEETQLNLLHSTALLPHAEVYFVRVNDSLIPYDALAMEFLEGINAGGEIRLSREDMKKLGAVMIDNLIAWHNTCNPEGFGKINAPPPLRRTGCPVTAGRPGGFEKGRDPLPKREAGKGCIFPDGQGL